MAMNPLIMMDTCTLRTRGSEVNRKVTYTDTVIKCQWEPRHGAYRGLDGDTSEYSLEVITAKEGIRAHDLLVNGTETYEVVYVDDIYIRGIYHHSEVYAK